MPQKSPVNLVRELPSPLTTINTGMLSSRFHLRLESLSNASPHLGMANWMLVQNSNERQWPTRLHPPIWAWRLKRSGGLEKHSHEHLAAAWEVRDHQAQERAPHHWWQTRRIPRQHLSLRSQIIEPCPCTEHSGNSFVQIRRDAAPVWRSKNPSVPLLNRTEIKERLSTLGLERWNGGWDGDMRSRRADGGRHRQRTSRRSWNSSCSYRTSLFFFLFVFENLVKFWRTR